MDPIETNNEVVNALREKVNESVVLLYEGASIHDFRMVQGPTHTNLIFDVVVPYSVKESDGEIKDRISKMVSIIDETLTQLMSLLKSEGRLAVISFHSLEDKIVKRAFKLFENPCECDSRYPCVCGKKAVGKVITKKPILPSEKELEENNRSHSAKLRIIEKL